MPFTSRVNGVSYRQADVRQVRVRQPLQVRHDPANPHDSCACAVTTLDGALLGYIPHDLAERLLARGETAWDAVCEEVLAGGDTWGLRIRVGARTRATDEQIAAEAQLTAPVAPEPETPSKPRVFVYTKASNRLLGMLLERNSTHVTVRSPNTGNPATYPIALVQFRGPADDATTDQTAAAASGPAGAPPVSAPAA